MKLSEVPLHEIQTYLKRLQGRVMMSDGKPAKTAVLMFEGEDVVELCRMLYAAQLNLRHYEITKVDVQGRRR